ncbi:MAG TPA: hypothetical protein VFH37_02325 [Candidatus Saccharimonadales bacterium]|nr:hypothetical protein [Candidatus Saccharimonadales bacterium]
MSIKIPKALKKTLISIVVLVVLFAIAGVVYVYVSGRQSAPPAKPAPKKAVDLGLPKPQQPAANAAEGVAKETLISPVKAGQNTSFSVRTNPTSTCSIVVTYSGGAVAHDSGLANKKADPYGFVTWTWTVDPAVTPGTYPVTVTCVYNGRSGVVVDNLQVT